METNKKRKRVVISRDDVIKETARRLNLIEEDVKSILDCSETVIEDYLDLATPDTNIVVYGMNNVHFYSKWMEARLIPFMGKDIFYDDGALYEAKFLPTFKKERSKVMRDRIALAEAMRNLGMKE